MAVPGQPSTGIDENAVGRFFLGCLSFGALADVGGSLAGNPMMPASVPGIGANVAKMVGGPGSVVGNFLQLDAMAGMANNIASIAAPQQNPLPGPTIGPPGAA